MKSKPVVLWQKENGLASNVTTCVAEDLVSKKVKKKGQTEEKINSLAPSECIQQRQTRPLGEVRGNQAAQENKRLPELLPKLVQAVAIKKPLKNNYLYSIEIEERSEDMTSGEVQVNTTNKWVFVNRDSYYLLDDQDTSLPQIGGQALKATQKDRDKEVKAKVELVGNRPQHKARKEISCSRTTQIPLPFESGTDAREGVYRNRQVLQQTKDSVRIILESRIMASSIPTKSKQFNVTSLKISNPAFVVSYGKGNSNSIKPSSRSVAQHSTSHSTLVASIESKEATVSCCSPHNSQEIDDIIIENFHQQTKNPQELFSSLSEESMVITSRKNVNNDRINMSITATQSGKDGTYTILTSRPTSSMSTPSLLDTEGFNSHCEPNKKEDEKSNCLKVHETETSLANLSPYQTEGRNQGQGQIRAHSARPTWPSLIDIQRLKTGGFRYRPSTAKSKEVREMTDTKNEQPEVGENDVSGAVEKNASRFRRMGTIIVPSHTTVDCPLCNLYAIEPSDPHDKSITVYQHPNQPKSTELGNQNNLMAKTTTVSRTSVFSSNTKSRLTATLINQTTSKPITIIKCRPSKTFEKKRPVSGHESKVGRNHSKMNARVPIAAVYDQEQPCKFSYVKAPSSLYLNDE